MEAGGVDDDQPLRLRRARPVSSQLQGVNSPDQRQEPRVLLDGLAFPEGPRWHDAVLWFVNGGTVCRVDLNGTMKSVAPIEGGASGMGFLADGTAIVVSMRGRCLMRLSGSDPELHADLRQFPGDFLNDMVVDGQGVAYVGTRRTGMQPTFAPHSEADELDALVLVEPDGSARLAADGLISPNGAVISPDGRVLIVAETYGHRLTRFDRAADGSLHGRRVFAEVPGRFPDGICLDEEGAVWFGSPYSDEFVRVREGGEIADRVPLPTGVACALGGPDRCTLFLLQGNAAYLPTVPDRPQTTSALSDDPVESTARIWTMTVPHQGVGWP
jgi:sugar lactone lactonase YvrE